MRLAVLSDVHGNLPALEAVLGDMQRDAPDGLIVAGDLTGGPHTRQTLALLTAARAHMIRGNGASLLLEYAAGDGPAAWREALQFDMLRWDYRHAGAETLELLRSLPDERTVGLPGTPPIRVVHGSPRHPAESIYPERDPALLALSLGMTAEPVLICGHTHEPWSRVLDGKLALNPGAVCGPLNGFVGAQYALLSWDGTHWAVEHRAVLYDVGRVRTAFAESGLLDEGGALARAFLRSIETGRDAALAFLSHAYSLAEAAGHVDCEFVPDAAWQRAAATFAWE